MALLVVPGFTQAQELVMEETITAIQQHKMEKATRTKKQTKRAPAKTTKAAPRKKFTYLKGYRELVPDPWGLGLES